MRESCNFGEVERLSGKSTLTCTAVFEGWKDTYCGSAGLRQDYTWNRTDSEAGSTLPYFFTQHYHPPAMLMRIQEGFLTEEADPQEILSNNLKQMKQMTATTYQALYSAMKREQGTLEEDSGEAAEEDAAASEAVDGVDAADSKWQPAEWTEEADGEKETEQVDYRDFDIFKAVKEAGITTICLDEAHHLRSEWWKALETFLDKLPDVKSLH